MEMVERRRDVLNRSCCQHIVPISFSYSNSHPFHCCQCCPSCPYCQQNRLVFGFCVPTCSSCPLPLPTGVPSSGDTGGGDPSIGQYLGSTGRGGDLIGDQSSGDIEGDDPSGVHYLRNNGEGGDLIEDQFSGHTGGNDSSGGQSSGISGDQSSESESEDNEDWTRTTVKLKLEVNYPIEINPSWGDLKLYVLAVQSVVTTFAGTAMVPSLIVGGMGGNSVHRAQVIQASFFTMAISSLLEVWLGTRLPVLMHKSRSFTIPVIAIALSSASRYNSARFSKIDNSQIFKDSMRRIQGASIIGAIFQIIIGFSRLGEIFARYLSPLAIVPLVTLTGFRIFIRGFPVLANCNAELGLPALVLLVFSTQYLPYIWKSKKEFLDQYSVTFCAAILWAYAEILNRAGAYDNNARYASRGKEFSCAINSGVVDVAPWIKIPLPFPYGGPLFEFGDASLIVAACFVDIIESVGTYIATSRLAGAKHFPPPVLRRGIGLQGIGNLVDALFGTGGGSTASVEQAGLVGLTQVGGRRITLVSVVLMLLCSFIGKLGALISSIPLPIEVAIQLVLLPFVASSGLDYLQFCNMNSFRLIFIIGFSIFMGLSVPQYFYAYAVISGQGPVRTSSSWFNDTLRVIFSSPPMVGLIVAFFLDLTHFPKVSSIKRDRDLKKEESKKEDLKKDLDKRTPKSFLIDDSRELKAKLDKRAPKVSSIKRDSGWEWKNIWDATDPSDKTYSIASNFKDLFS